MYLLSFPSPIINRNKLLSVLLLGGTLLVGLSAQGWSQASINEGLETAAIYVDADKVSDSNNGSKTTPLKTIGASVNMALANNYAGIGSRVIVNAGTYRESVAISGGALAPQTCPSPSRPPLTHGLHFGRRRDEWMDGFFREPQHLSE